MSSYRAPSAAAPVASGAAVVLVAASCGIAGDAAPEQVVRDSAGVAIVEIRETAWETADEWRLEPEPSVAIGVVDGGPEAYQLFRVTDAVRFPGDTVVVANSGTAELRYYDAEGRYVRSVGGSGEGPGEYRMIGFVDRLGSDSLIVWDGNLRRGTILGRDGGFGRTFPGPDLEEEYYTMLGTVRDGTLLGHRAPGIDIRGMPTQVLRNTAIFFRFSPAGERARLGEHFINEVYVSDDRMIAMPFGYRGVSTGGRERFDYGAAEAYEIRSFDLDGGVVRIVRSARPNRPLQRRAIAELLERVVLYRVARPHGGA
ncbi:MAG: hypothetical protein ACOC8B_02435 [Gemmatimonadota bacterium]